jgi:hypothetical protein
MQARRAEEERIRAELDSEVPDWEAKYGDQLQALQAFLASDALTHATFGTKQGLLLRLLDPSISRRDILREMKDKPRQGVRTGRSGQPTRSNLGDKLRETHREKGWGEMWNLIQSNPDAILNEFRE